MYSDIDRESRCIISNSYFALCCRNKIFPNPADELIVSGLIYASMGENVRKA